MDVDLPSVGDGAGNSPKKVSFAADAKPGSASSSRLTSVVPESVADSEAKPTALDGVIGQLEVYQSGAVKMRLHNGIVLDVSIFSPDGVP
jgi:DNA-directed RNA polymerase III subunit RPC4